ncbi:secondary thiamine-phosphate synthase enzyme YjbQ [Amphritea sp. 1_MG-2023]|uniref:secondary thiamine-phosphate synthase enzyme YjbQ n=1 Tax=Amphritea sp. 1_MG-2023 TaxID=3062670 RepID=UPI0026E3FA53|nr:secondary thiamine-phosphate synthase enzyme YjbQ [Amphritea sp. 1_MG-2023]MDO6563095.1 secondary thiamine-phosphate synthase enzyme YjbQ [Amphritea sp. 1_MG-2023]
MIDIISVSTRGQGLYEFTGAVDRLVSHSEVQEGLCSLLIQHTSASLMIQENADPSAQHDLENWLSRLVREDDALYTHVAEGPDDMPAHIKAALTATTLSVPIHRGRLMLGTWQGIFCWEHRHHHQQRQIAVHIG